MTAASAPKPPDPISGLRRPPLASSSPTGKGDRDTQQAKKKVRAMNLDRLAGFEDVEIEDDGWYVSESDSEDVAEALREEDDEVNEEEEDPLCPQISDLKNGCYLVRFRSQEDYKWAITGGPWMLGDTYLTVHC
ncbi:hypothetical protein LINGRAHAP2_LOCUS10770 [Linum grandiflorum]